MPLPWTVLKFIFKILGPSIPDLVSTVSALKKQRQQTQHDPIHHHFAEVEKALSSQLELIEQLTDQLVEFQRLVRKAIILAIFAIVLGLISLGLLLVP